MEFTGVAGVVHAFRVCARDSGGNTQVAPSNDPIRYFTPFSGDFMAFSVGNSLGEKNKNPIWEMWRGQLIQGPTRRYQD